MTFGHVRFWNRDEGWGVLDGAEVPGGCWAHLSAIDMAGFRQLHAGQEVRFLFEPGKQDGYDYRATAITVDGPEPSIHEPSPSNGAYQSSIHIPLAATPRSTRAHGSDDGCAYESDNEGALERRYFLG